MESDQAQTIQRPRHSPARSMLTWIVILGLAGLVLWLASERNARLFYLVPNGNEVVIKKGMFFPVGREAIKPDDATYGKAYAPVKPPPGQTLPEERSFDDRAELDQGLYDLLAGWARGEITSERPEQLQRGLGYLARAEMLPGLSAAQRDDLRGLRAESGFYEARGLIEHGAEELRQAREKLRFASEATTRHASDALVLLRRLEPLVDEAVSISRQADGSRAEPARAPAAAGPAPAAPNGPKPPAPPSP